MRVIFQGVELVDNDYFITEENVGMLKLAKETNTILVRIFHFDNPYVGSKNTKKLLLTLLLLFPLLPSV